jgi:hypothetical protein
VPIGQRVFLCIVSEPAINSPDERNDAAADDTQMNIDSSPVPNEDEQTVSKTKDQSTLDEPSKASNIAENSDHASQAKPDVEAEVKQEEIQVKEDHSTTDQPMARNPPEDHPISLPKRGRGRPRKRKALDDEIAVNTAPETTEAPVDTNTEPSCPIENGASLNQNQGLTPDTEKEPHESSILPTTSMDVDSPEVDKPSQADAEKPQSEDNLRLSPTPLEIEIHNIAGPNALMKKILEIDGRITNPPNGNAWKEFRCYRNNQDMGSLWDVRQAWYVKFQQE